MRLDHWKREIANVKKHQAQQLICLNYLIHSRFIHVEREFAHIGYMKYLIVLRSNVNFYILSSFSSKNRVDLFLGIKPLRSHWTIRPLSSNLKIQQRHLGFKYFLPPLSNYQTFVINIDDVHLKIVYRLKGSFQTFCFNIH